MDRAKKMWRCSEILMSSGVPTGSFYLTKAVVELSSIAGPNPFWIPRKQIDIRNSRYWFVEGDHTPIIRKKVTRAIYFAYKRWKWTTNVFDPAHSVPLRPGQLTLVDVLEKKLAVATIEHHIFDLIGKWNTTSESIILYEKTKTRSYLIAAPTILRPQKQKRTNDWSIHYFS